METNLTFISFLTGRGFVRKGQFAGEVGRASHEQDRSVREGEGNERQGFGSEEGA